MMIEVKVKIPFRDRETGKTYKRDDTLKLTPQRFTEIVRKGDYVEAIEKRVEKERTSNGV